MITREPTIERLAIAQGLLLDPFGLTETHLAATLAAMGEHKVDDADLYFQTTRHEGWSLEEGIVKSGSFSIDQGVGVRAVAGEKTAFAYSDDISAASLMDAARTVRAIAAAGQSRRVKLQTKPEDLHQPPAVRHGRPDRHARQHAEGRAARAHREDGPRARPAHRAGDGRPGRRTRRGADRARRRHARRRRAPAGAPVDHRHRRTERPSRDGLGRRRRALRPGLFHRGHPVQVRRPGRQRGAGQPRVASGARRRDDRRPRARAGPACCCTRRSATASKATSTARARARSPGASASAWRPRASPCWTTAPSPTAAARSTSTTKATRASATC